MKIIQLKAENVKKITAVEITPGGSLVIIGGKNGAGKSSCLDSIMYALAGGDSLPKKPVRRGEDKAKIELDLGDVIVKRTFTAEGGTSLVVTNKDGVKFSSPQAMLDGLVGKLSFDPLEFAQQKPEKQSDTLTALLGLDFTKQDAEAERIFDERTVSNREGKALQARLVAMPEHKDVSGDEQSTEAVLAEQAETSKKNAANAEARNMVGRLKADVGNAEQDCQRRQSKVQALQKQIAALQEELAMESAKLVDVRASANSLVAQYESERVKVEKLTDYPLAPFAMKLASIEQTNHKIRQNKAKEEIRAQFMAKTKEAETLTTKIEAIAKQKRQAIAAAKFPIEGLGLDDSRNVTFDGLPFEQASTALQLRVSIAIGLALNKQLPVLLIRRGSDLDEDSLKLVAEMAEKADAQVWLERVGEDGNVSVIIEDGHVQESVRTPSEIASGFAAKETEAL